jgi:uncharacterized protein
MRHVMGLAIALFTAWAVLVALAYVLQRQLIYPGAMLGGAISSPAPWGEYVTLETGDGEQLAALYQRPADGAATVLFLHGNADRIDRYGFLARHLGSYGIGLLAVSYRGYVGSTGRPSESGLLADGEAAFDWLRRLHDGPIVVMGQSLGSGVAIHLAANRPVDDLILISAYDSIRDVARASYPFLPVRSLLKDRYSSDLWIAGVETRKLFVHGTRDGVIPIAHARRLFDLAGEPKTFVELEGFGHNDIWAEELLELIVERMNSP